jgi:cytidylate kinase
MWAPSFLSPSTTASIRSVSFARSSERPGIGADALATDLRLRDEKDAINMRPAEDAIQIDTTALDVDEVVARIEELVHARQTT